MTKEWRPGTLGQVDKVLTAMLEEAVDAQRSLTDYDGPDEGWHSHVADRRWDAERYHGIGFYSGYISSVMDAVDRMKAMIPAPVLERAGLYVYD